MRAGSKRPQPPEARAPTQIALRPRDCHSHVLPAVDDGSRTLAESLAMLGLLREAGARRVVATPHIFPGRFPNEPEPLRKVHDALCRAAEAASVDVTVELGAEHYLDDTLAARVADGAFLAFGPERYLLFETHTGPTIPVGLFDAIHAMTSRGLTPLLAHVERYRWARGDEGAEVLEDLRAAGVRFQVNRTVGAVNVPGKGPRGRLLARLLRHGWVDEVGSDLHRPTPDGRPQPTAPTPAPS